MAPRARPAAGLVAPVVRSPLASTALPPASSRAASSAASVAVASASDALRLASSALSSAQNAASNVAHGQPAQSDGPSNPSWFQYVGLILAIVSGILIGVSFVVKKLGLLAAQRKYQATPGEGMHYLKSVRWWCGMILMICGELCNLGAYSFADAIIVTPMGALSVVISAMLSSWVLKEKLSLFGWLGCALCILGSTTIALNAPSQHSSGQIEQFQKLFVSPGFLTWVGICVVAALLLIVFAVPRWGKTHMLVHISICSVIGGLSVSVTTGLGGALLLSIQGHNQMKHWFVYFLLVFVVVTLVTEVIYLNKALELFNTAMVTPTYYVLFTFCSLVSTIILNKGLNAPVTGIISIVCAFLTICIGITILQLSKLDPKDLAKQPGVDRRTTLLLKASRSHVRRNGDEEKDTPSDGQSPDQDSLPRLERDGHVPDEGEVLADPGPETIRGGLGVVGSIIRARSVARSRRSRRTPSQRSSGEHGRAYSLGERSTDALTDHTPDGKARYRLYDEPLSTGSHVLTSVREDGSGQGGTHLTVPSTEGHSPYRSQSRVSHSPSEGGPERKVTFTRAALEHSRSGRSTAAAGLQPRNSARSITAGAGSFYRFDPSGEDQAAAQVYHVPSARSTVGRLSRPDGSSGPSVEDTYPPKSRGSPAHGWRNLLIPHRPSRPLVSGESGTVRVVGDRDSVQHGGVLVATAPLSPPEERHGGFTDEVPDSNELGYGYHAHQCQDSLASLPPPLNLQQAPYSDTKLDVLDKDEASPPAVALALEPSSQPGESAGEISGGPGLYRDISPPAFYFDDTSAGESDAAVQLSLPSSRLRPGSRDPLASPRPAPRSPPRVESTPTTQGGLLARPVSAERSSAPPPPLSRKSTEEAVYDAGVVDAYGYPGPAPSSLRGLPLVSSSEADHALAHYGLSPPPPPPGNDKMDIHTY